MFMLLLRELYVLFFSQNHQCGVGPIHFIIIQYKKHYSVAEQLKSHIIQLLLIATIKVKV